MPCKLVQLFAVIHVNLFTRLNKPGERFKTLESMINQILYLIWVVLFHDTRPNDARSNDAGFMRKLWKQG